MPQMNEFDKTQLPKDLAIAWFFEENLETEWLSSVPAKITAISEKRIREYAASRKALSLACSIYEIDQLEIEAHHHLKNHPHIKVSLSHTRGLSAAVASKELVSVGVDVEFIDREFNHKTSKFFLRDDDLEMPLLELWTIKEAAFKAIDPMGLKASDKDILVLKDLRVKDQSIELEGKEASKWLLQKHDGVMTAVSWIS